MRKLQLTGLNYVAAALAISIFSACQEAPNKAPTMPPNPTNLPTSKPDRVSSARVGMTALVELAHLERAIKPFNGIAIAKDTCRTMRTTNRAQWETTWNCGTNAKERGRTEITGTEQMNYDHPTRTLEYRAKLETRFFEDLEPRAQAQTIVTFRRIKVHFERGSTEEASRGNLVMTTTVSNTPITNPADGKAIPGSNYKMRFTGTLARQGSEWTLENKSRIEFDGLLFGLGAERKTNWASGLYGFIGTTAIALPGLGESSCTKPIGTWRLQASGGGRSLDTIVQSSDAEGVMIDGSALGWTTAYCNEP